MAPVKAVGDRTVVAVQACREDRILGEILTFGVLLLVLRVILVTRNHAIAFGELLMLNHRLLVGSSMLQVLKRVVLITCLTVVQSSMG